MAASVVTDRYWMRQAMALAALAEGATQPNPRVGCVVVLDGQVVGRGYHVAAGKAHAEAMALAEAGVRARGATLYVNLEPCAHRGLTPPCDQTVIGSGIRRVVAALKDPNPLVNGRGFGNLRSAGIDVQVGLLSDEATRLNEAFLHRHETGRPLVTLKAGMSSDGRLSARGGESRWITGQPARRFAHRLRFRHDAILIGAGTARRDDPSLTVRLKGLHAARRRVLLGGGGPIDPTLRLFRSADVDGTVRIYTTEGNGSRYADAPAEVIELEGSDGSVDPGALLDDLGREGVQSVLVEGGGRTLASFLRAGVAQRVALFVSPRLLGDRGSTPLLNLESPDEPGLSWSVDVERTIPLGEDLLFDGRLVAPPAGHA